MKSFIEGFISFITILLTSGNTGFGFWAGLFWSPAGAIAVYVSNNKHRPTQNFNKMDEK
jgi:hypothetical protein